MAVYPRATNCGTKASKTLCKICDLSDMRSSPSVQWAQEHKCYEMVIYCPCIQGMQGSVEKFKGVLVLASQNFIKEALDILHL